MKMSRLKTSSSLICKLSLLLVSLSPSGDFLQQFNLRRRPLFFTSLNILQLTTDKRELDTEPLQPCVKD